jgi:hypothetical protein
MILSHLQYWLLFCLTRPHQQANIRPFRFGIPWIAKITWRTTSTEADALRFLHASGLDLPIPRLIWSFAHGESTFTIMQRIEGDNLCIMRYSLDEQARQNVLAEIQVVLDKLSTLTPPVALRGKVMSSSSGHGLPDSVQFFDTRCGPFDSKLECWSYMSNCFCMDEFYEMTDVDTRRTMEDDPIVYVHPDLRMYNVIIKDGHISAIIDWQDSGWLPSSWQVHTLRWPTSAGCSGWWFLYWRDQHTFSPEAEAAYKASKSFLTKSPV